MNRWFTVLISILVTGCAYVKVPPLHPPVQGIEEQVVEGEGRAKIVVAEISGVITLGPFGLERFKKEPPLIPRLKEELRAAMQDEDVVGLVVRIDSPGGSVTASDILYHELSSFRDKKGVPVIVSVMDKAFSGGYYAALAADEIMVHPTSVIGGVGVIAFKFNVAGLLERWGIENESVQSGELKDFWSPLRQSRPEETALMQGITNRLHQRFLGIVKERRQLKPCVLKQVAKGGVFDAGPAKDLALVDHIGYLEDAVARVRELAGVEQARVIIYRRPGVYAENIYAGALPLGRELLWAEQATEEFFNPSFRYQYLP